jgi:signal transduction histidine kinase
MGLILCGVQQKQVLSLADKAKVDFIANISHELRTPLHGVMASCDLLAETNLSDTQESFLSTAKQCASSLTETINHVLDFTKSTSQSTGHKREAVDLSQLIEETMIGCWLGRTTKQFSSENSTVAIGGLYAPQNLEQSDSDSRSVTKVEPLIEIEPQSNWTVMVDKAGLRRILINLIGNSMKFTQVGTVLDAPVSWSNRMCC